MNRRSSVGVDERDILARITETKRAEVALLRPRARELRQRAGDLPPTRGFAAALKRPETVAVLAEIKRRSPSAGPIRPGASADEIARAYEAGGAAALSVLTDREYFDGSLEALSAARAAVALPVLRKDFVIDPLQLWEARAAGADAALLIVRMLNDERLTELTGLAKELGLDILLEIHDRDELARARASGAALIGINNRDLRTFATDLGLSLELAPGVPSETTLVAESGIRGADDVDRLGEAGVDAVLVGESLMRQPDVRRATASLANRRKRANTRTP